MSKTIKKEAKPLKATPEKLPKTSRKEEVSNKCVDCNGSGLERPTFTNSPVCGVCNGAGIIN